MANRLSRKRMLDPDIFKLYLKNHNSSIRELGSVLNTNEKTIRRCVDARAITLTIAMEICDYFDDTCTHIFGPDHSREWQAIRNYMD